MRHLRSRRTICVSAPSLCDNVLFLPSIYPIRFIVLLSGNRSDAKLESDELLKVLDTPLSSFHRSISSPRKRDFLFSGYRADFKNCPTRSWCTAL